HLGVREFRQGNRYILYDADLIASPQQLVFDASDWAARSAIIGFAEGRGTTFFVQHEGRDFVLRHYLRGGFIARVSADRYVWLGCRRTRAFREWHLLARMREMSLPVPQPAAARVIRRGLFYTADLMTVRIPEATTLSELLTREPLAEGYWIALGSLLLRFHVSGVYHADLNANNILLDRGGRFHLIDFDRGRLRRPGRRWQEANLNRLRRSLDKLARTEPEFHFREQDWQNLLTGYRSAGLA
ncbi:MAG TPA: 3-deoxy-D-manno-octulosonic acid kinase, partial [Thiotrichales bacterium]|nr:3-deoxy-D-manno-octulosonic acid kinase [Thiotrichales bacterium]